VHVILDNFSTHKTDLVKNFLQQRPERAADAQAKETGPAQSHSVS